MNQESNRSQNNIFNEQTNQSNGLWQYVQSLNPETIARLSQPESGEVFQVMEKNIIGLLGNLPGENFDISINTSRESLGKLLASAMISGYFLRNAEQRMQFEQQLEHSKE
ncbi:MAG: DUF760 domain-containing protein [Cyanobacteria bacterium J083]|nr:MAG: DUF760 domain-containing protein [Cyanobacteria bacterium J083]